MSQACGGCMDVIVEAAQSSELIFARLSIATWFQAEPFRYGPGLFGSVELRVGI